MKIFTFRKFVQYYLPLTLSLFMYVTIERTVVTDGGYDRLYGLPLPYITGSYACSFCYVVAIPAMLCNLLFCFGVSVLIFGLLQRIGLFLSTHWLFVSAGTIVSLFWVTVFLLMTADGFFRCKIDTAYEVKSRRIVFGLRP